MSLEMSPTETASLVQLQQTPIDTVLNIIDDGLVQLPSYRELYYRWERQQWQTQEIDFLPDLIQWEQMDEEEQEEFVYVVSSFFQGEASVADGLAPYVSAMPREEQRYFLTTQLVDEARHTIFFSRFVNEVMGVDEGELSATLALAQEFMSEPARYILIDSLNEVADRLRREPGNMPLLVEAVALYHIIIEGTIALAGQRSMLERCRKENLFPGFRGGFTAVARDESRHVIFGVKFLRDMLHEERSHARTLQAAIEKYAPAALASLAPAEAAIPAMLARGEDPWQSQRYGQDSLRKKLRVIGLNMALPDLP